MSVFNRLFAAMTDDSLSTFRFICESHTNALNDAQCYHVVEQGVKWNALKCVEWAMGRFNVNPSFLLDHENSTDMIRVLLRCGANANGVTWAPRCPSCLEKNLLRIAGNDYSNARQSVFVLLRAGASTQNLSEPAQRQLAAIYKS